MVESLDASVGEVLRALHQTGQERDTVVLFTSDNGGERFSYHWPFSGNKDELLEGGIRVPTILRWPAKIRGHQTSHTPVITQDWTATILAVAGAQPAPSHPLDGMNLADHLWRGAPAPARDLFWRTRSQAALRRDRWKYYRSPAGEHLFDLGTDEHEQANLAKKQPHWSPLCAPAGTRSTAACSPTPHCPKSRNSPSGHTIAEDTPFIGG